MTVTDRRRKPMRRAQLGVTVEQYDALLAAQGGGCAICGELPRVERPLRAWKCRYCGFGHGKLAYDEEACLRCGKARPALRRLDVDHDHRTGAVRGLLCHRCNRALPNWVTPPWLGKALAYLMGGGRDPDGQVRYEVVVRGPRSAVVTRKLPRG